MTKRINTSIRIRLLSQWPADDRHRWLASCTAGRTSFLDSLSSCAALASLKSRPTAARYEETTRINLIEAWGQYLEYLACTNLLDISAGTPARANPQFIFSYLQTLETLGRAPQTIGTRANSIAMFITVTCPGVDVRSLQRAASVLRRGEPFAAKSGRIVDPGVLIQLGLDLTELPFETGTSVIPSVEDAIRFRDGVMIALLAQRPIRRENFAGLELGASFTRENDVYWIHLTPDQVKTDTAIDVPCPDTLTELIDTYLKIYRPILLQKTDCKALWIAASGGQNLTPMGVYQAIRKRTSAALGFSVNPHLFRDCAATFMAHHSPELAWMIAGLLGHTNLATSKKYYIQGQSKAGHDAYQGLVTAIRSGEAMASSSSHLCCRSGDHV